MKTLFKNSRSYAIVTTGQSVALIVGRIKSNDKISKVIADITDFC